MSIKKIHKEEYQKCKENPYYFATKYVEVNGKPFQTSMNEEEFNTFARYFNVLPLEPEHCGVKFKVIEEEITHGENCNEYPTACKKCIENYYVWKESNKGI